MQKVSQGQEILSSAAKASSATRRVRRVAQSCWQNRRSLLSLAQPGM